MNKRLTLLIFGIILLSLSSIAQDVHTHDKITLGLGVGLDYGGVGANATLYPHKNIGIFGSVGYALEGLGYNAGIKLRDLPHNPKQKVLTYFTAMYGYNTVLVIKNEPDRGGFAYGFTLGAGVDLYVGKERKNYLSVALLVPLRDKETINYINGLQYGQKDVQRLWPIVFSLGYKIPLL